MISKGHNGELNPRNKKQLAQLSQRDRDGGGSVLVKSERRITLFCMRTL